MVLGTPRPHESSFAGAEESEPCAGVGSHHPDAFLEAGVGDTPEQARGSVFSSSVSSPMIKTAQTFPALFERLCFAIAQADLLDRSLGRESCPVRALPGGYTRPGFLVKVMQRLHLPHSPAGSAAWGLGPGGSGAPESGQNAQGVTF